MDVSPKYKTTSFLLRIALATVITAPPWTSSLYGIFWWLDLEAPPTEATQTEHNAIDQSLTDALLTSVEAVLNQATVAAGNMSASESAVLL